MNKFFVNLSRGFLVTLSKLPLKFHYFMGDILAWLLRVVFRYRYSVVLINVARSFPEKTYYGLPKLTKEFYNHLGELMAETIWFSGCDYKRVRKSGIVKITNPEVLVEYFEKSPSITVLSTHCGNWELLGGFFAYLDNAGIEYPFTQDNMRVVYKKLSNKVGNEVFKRNRVSPLGKGKEECAIESSYVLRYAIAHKNEKKIYVYPADQAPYYRTGKHFIGDFMGQPTSAMQGSMGVACKLSHAVLYLKMKRVKRGEYEMTLIPICENASQMSPEELIRKYYDLLEEEIRETPANWLWSHKRWK